MRTLLGADSGSEAFLNPFPVLSPPALAFVVLPIQHRAELERRQVGTGNGLPKPAPISMNPRKVSNHKPLPHHSIAAATRGKEARPQSNESGQTEAVAFNFKLVKLSFNLKLS